MRSVASKHQHGGAAITGRAVIQYSILAIFNVQLQVELELELELEVPTTFNHNSGFGAEHMTQACYLAVLVGCLFCDTVPHTK